MCAPSGPPGKQTTSPARSCVLAVGRPDASAAGDDEQPLLDAVVVVVGADPLALLELVDRGPDQLAADRLVDSRGALRIAGPVPLVLRLSSSLKRLKRRTR